MATDTGVLILSPEGRLRCEAASVFESIVSEQKALASLQAKATAMTSMLHVCTRVCLTSESALMKVNS